MIVEVELNKLKEIFDKRKRHSRPENKNKDRPSSPNSFLFDDENNEVFGDSFLIDTTNKELEAKIANLENEQKTLQQIIKDKQEEINGLRATIYEYEGGSGKLSEPKKSESFEFMNSDNIKHIRDVLFKFLKKVPYSDPSNEALLEIVFSMLYMKENEITEIKESRDIISGIKKKEKPKEKPKEAPKKSKNIFGRLAG